MRLLVFNSREGGGSYETDGDARRLAWGCKFWILVSLRVFRAQRQHFKPPRATELREEKQKSNFPFNFFCFHICVFLAVSFRGQNLLKPRPDWSPLGVTKSLSHAQMVSLRG